MTNGHETDLLLISPPAVRPTSPCLGPAALLAYIRREQPDASCSFLDLNLAYYQQILRRMESGSFKLRLYDWDFEETAFRVLRAARHLKSAWPSMQEMDEFHRQATIFLSFEQIVNGFMRQMALKMASDAGCPREIEAIFHRLADKIASFRPAAAGFSILYDCQMEMAVLLSKLLKKRLPNCLILFGGSRFGVDPRPERIFEKVQLQGVNGQGPAAIDAGSFIDALIPGEGERPLAELMKRLRHSGRKEALKGPWLIRPKGGGPSPKQAAAAADITDLPPPDFSDYPLSEYLAPVPILPYLTSRGCPWGRCAFCTHHRSYMRYRQIPVARAVEQLEQLSSHYGCSHFNLLDEMIPPGRFRRLAAAIEERGLKICYSAYAKPVRAFDQETMKGLYRSGARLILWGLESGSQRILDLMDKGTKIPQAARVLQDSAAAGIMNLVFIMFGFPGETRDEFFETMRFVETHSGAIHGLSKGTFLLLEGSRIFNDPERFGICCIKPAADGAPFSVPAFHYRAETGMQPEEVRKLYRQNLKRIEATGICPRLGAFRDHMLLVSCGQGRPGSVPERALML